MILNHKAKSLLQLSTQLEQEKEDKVYGSQRAVPAATRKSWSRQKRLLGK